MDIDTLDVFTIDITAQVVTFVDDQTTFAMAMSHTCKRSAINACTNNQIVVLLIHNSLIFLQK
jgi:hypothetical protein